MYDKINRPIWNCGPTKVHVYTSMHKQTYMCTKKVYTYMCDMSSMLGYLCKKDFGALVLILWLAVLIWIQKQFYIG